jgi:FemAB family protein
MTIVDNIMCLAESCDLSIQLRTYERDTWTKTLLSCLYVPFVYTNASIDYQLAYQRSHGGNWKDLSLIINWDNKPAALWPLSLGVKDENIIFNSHCLPVLPLLFASECPASSRKRITKSCLDLAHVIAKTAGIQSWESAESFSGQSESGLSKWHAESICRGAIADLRHELFVDLSLEIAAIKACFRKSYKSLITSGMRAWQVDVMAETNPELWNEFRELHFKVAGRVTRSAETWELQRQAIDDGNALLVYLLNDRDDMVGGGFFNITPDEGVYSVAAYDRSLFDKPLGHVVQYRAIEEMKRRGLRWYKIGSRVYSSELPAPTEKEISISNFKEGFASHLFPQYCLTHKVGNNETN